MENYYPDTTAVKIGTTDGGILFKYRSVSQKGVLFNSLPMVCIVRIMTDSENKSETKT